MNDKAELVCGTEPIVGQRFEAVIVAGFDRPVSKTFFTLRASPAVPRRQRPYPRCGFDETVATWFSTERTVFVVSMKHLQVILSLSAGLLVACGTSEEPNDTESNYRTGDAGGSTNAQGSRDNPESSSDDEFVGNSDDDLTSDIDVEPAGDPDGPSSTESNDAASPVGDASPDVKPNPTPTDPSDLTFFVSSDSHYASWSYKANQASVDDMNSLPGKAYPTDIKGGGPVGTPRGVLMLGDLVDDGSKEQFKLFVEHFGVNGEGRCKYPVYEGWGNHDGPPIAEEVQKRNPKRVGLTAISDNGKHYSWDWGRVHFVNVNIWPGDEYTYPKYDPVWHSPEKSLSFLKRDLAENVGNSGRPVIIVHHYDVTQPDWWGDVDKDRYYEAIKNYNVALIIFGHTGTKIWEWRGIRFLNDGNLNKGFFVVNISGDKMSIAPRFYGKWANGRKTFTIKS